MFSFPVLQMLTYAYVFQTSDSKLIVFWLSAMYLSKNTSLTSINSCVHSSDWRQAAMGV